MWTNDDDDDDDNNINVTVNVDDHNNNDKDVDDDDLLARTPNSLCQHLAIGTWQPDQNSCRSDF